MISVSPSRKPNRRCRSGWSWSHRVADGREGDASLPTISIQRRGTTHVLRPRRLPAEERPRRTGRALVRRRARQSRWKIRCLSHRVLKHLRRPFLRYLQEKPLRRPFLTRYLQENRSASKSNHPYRRTFCLARRPPPNRPTLRQWMGRQGPKPLRSQNNSIISFRSDCATSYTRREPRTILRASDNRISSWTSGCLVRTNPRCQNTMPVSAPLY